jgi:hypothetical protein
MLTTKTGKFVHVVASVNRATKTGKIHYVNPASVTTTSDAPAAGAQVPTPFEAFALSVRDVAGHELLRMSPTVQISRCEGELPETALVNQELPLTPNMKTIVLLHDDVEVDRFEAGPPKVATGLAAGMAPLQVGPPNPAKPHRLPLQVDGNAAPHPGVSYTVQVRPQGASAWQTISVGRPQPNIDLDRNQFPGVSTATVRVLRTNGFEDEIVAEQDVALDK